MSIRAIGRLLGAALLLALAATPALAQGGSSFDGTWIMRRSFNTNETGPGCSPIGVDFRIRIRGGVVFAPGGRGSVSPSGAIRFPGTGNYFTGTLRGNTASGTFRGRCTGTFSGRRV
jgi:hypothetical protein